GLKAHSRSGAPVMQNLRLFVKFLADPMAAEFAHHAVSIGFRVLLDGGADVAQERARPYRPDSQPHALVGRLAKALCLDRGLLDDQIVAKAVELARGDSWFHARGHEIEHFRGELTGNPHALDLIVSLQMYRHARQQKCEG